MPLPVIVPAPDGYEGLRWWDPIVRAWDSRYRLVGTEKWVDVGQPFGLATQDASYLNQQATWWIGWHLANRAERD